ncbi:hypothetical protein TanjilG_14283 [Lupinus angustifolius]|uniref:Protein kinase domain-containing protein n=1 Tax=Lupinus angustifolius TaxID=3871 RepID=A0A1J7GWS6_LUPAN|nr:hypothetical protein TanjilG_14283 [Lupinus angustifolius]
MQLLLLPLLLHFHHHPTTAHTLSEYHSLLSFKSTSITSDPTHFLSSWTSNTPYYTWPSITCDSSNHHVTAVNLTSLSLSGTLHLPFLSTLSLADNKFSGPVPPSLSSLTFLIHLNLSNNNFNSTFPSQLSNLENLQVLDFYNNNMSGPLPVSITNMTSSKHLHLGVNTLSGSLISELGNLKNLKSMDLSNNALSGEVPASFSLLKNLTLLNLFRNKLHGAILEFIGELPDLEVLQLWENNFTGSIPWSLGQNGKLTLVDLSSNKLMGSLPPDLCFEHKLQTLITLGSFLFGPIPDSIGKCESLTRIRMGENFLNGSIPKRLFGLPKLTQVELQDNFLSGNFPESGSMSPNHGQITLSNNQLYGPLPPTIGNFTSMQKLLLDGNKFSGPIPPQIGRLHQLSKIDFSHNNFSGPIAKEISHCKLLTFVDLSRNELSGEIPNEIKNMRILNYLNLSRNYLVGAIPGSIASMQSLTSVDFSYNNLSGLVPGTGQFNYFSYTSFLGNPELCGSYLGHCKEGVGNGPQQPHVKGPLSPSLKLLLVIGQLVCSVAFAVTAILKARSLKKADGARVWKLITFQCIVYKGAMPNKDLVAVKRLPTMSRGSSHDHGFNAEIQTLGRIRHRLPLSKVDEKSDVYSFGVVLLELVTGRKPVGEFGDGVDIVQWVRKMTDSNKEGVLKVLDPRLPSIPIEEVMHVFYVVMLCVEEQAVERPTMREVVQILTELPKPPGSKQGDLTITKSSLTSSNGSESPNTASSKEPNDQEHPPKSAPPDLLSI